MGFGDDPATNISGVGLATFASLVSERSSGFVTADPAAARASLARLAEARFEVAVFGHGQAVRGQAVERFKKVAAA